MVFLSGRNEAPFMWQRPNAFSQQYSGIDKRLGSLQTFHLPHNKNGPDNSFANRATNRDGTKRAYVKFYYSTCNMKSAGNYRNCNRSAQFDTQDVKYAHGIAWCCFVVVMLLPQGHSYAHFTPILQGYLMTPV